MAQVRLCVQAERDDRRHVPWNGGKDTGVTGAKRDRSVPIPFHGALLHN